MTKAQQFKLDIDAYKKYKAAQIEKGVWHNDEFYVDVVKQQIFLVKAYLKETDIYEIPSFVSGISGSITDSKVVNLKIINRKNRIKDMSEMFSYWQHLKYLDLSEFDTTGVVDLSYMFLHCIALETLDLSKFNITEVQDMVSICRGCESLRTIRLPTSGSKKLRNLCDSFGGCTSLTSLDLSVLDTDNVTSMGCLFKGCTNLQEINLEDLVTTKVIDMQEMFKDCRRLKVINLGSFETKNTTNMDCMFFGCTLLNSLNLACFDTTKVKHIYNIFGKCLNLKKIILNNKNTTKLRKEIPANCAVFIPHIESSNLYVENLQIPPWLLALYNDSRQGVAQYITLDVAGELLNKQIKARKFIIVEYKREYEKNENDNFKRTPLIEKKDIVSLLDYMLFLEKMAKGNSKVKKESIRIEYVNTIYGKIPNKITYIKENKRCVSEFIFPLTQRELK